MPLRRYQIRNEYGLADPELYRAAAKDDPEALLEGISMAGLVGVLRQLGDLAEFAAEVFHDLHEEVMTTAARGHGLIARVQQLEADFPALEKALLSKTNDSSSFSNADIVDWHPNLQSQKNSITGGDLPRFIMDSYEECLGPPRLFLLDKFDVAGAGACLKRYTDPSVFKTESSSSERAVSKIHREKRTHKTKMKRMRRNGETPDFAPSHAKLHQLFLEERFENNYNDAAHLVKLKRRQLNGSGVDWKSERSYMQKFLDTLSPDNKIFCVTPSSPMPLNMLDTVHEDDQHNDSSVKEEPQTVALDECSETLADGKIATSDRHLNIASIAPIDSCSSVLPEDLGSVSYVAEPDGEFSKSEDGFVAKKFALEESYLTVDTLQAHRPTTGSTIEELPSALPCSNLQVEHSEGIEVLCDNQQSYGEVYQRMVNHEMRVTSTCGVDSVADDLAFEYLLHPSDHPELEIHQSLTDELSKAVDREDVVSGVPADDCTKNYDNEVIGPVSDVMSPSQNLTDMQESPAKVEDSDLKALHLTKAISIEFCKELKTQKQMRQPKPSSEIICRANNCMTDSHESVPENRDPCNGVEPNKPVPIEFDSQRDMNHQESYSCASSSAVGAFADLRESESISTVPHGRENLAYSTEILSELEAHEDTHVLQVVTPHLESMPDVQKICGNSDSDTYNTFAGSSEAELIYQSSGVYDSTTPTDVSNLEKDSDTTPISQSHDRQDDEAAKASVEHPEPGTFSGQSLESNGELDTTKSMKDFEKENFRTGQRHSSNTSNLNEYSTTASRFSSEIADKSPVLNCLSYPAEVHDQPKQFVYLIEPINPSLVPLPIQINNDDMPPMPPLPPMQWLGKAQSSSLCLRSELDGGSHVTFKPLLASRTDEKSELGLHTSHQGILLPENLFSAMDVIGGNPQHTSGFITSDLRQPVQIVQLTSSSNATGHTNDFLMEGSKVQNQFETSCSRLNEGHSRMYSSPGEEIFQQMNSSSQALPTENAGNVLDSVSLQEESVPLSSPPLAETSPKVHQSSPQNLEGMTMQSGIISSSPLFTETVQLQSNILPSDIDVLDPSHPISLSEDGKPNGQGSIQLPCPRNPLIDAVAAHDKNKLRKVAERVRPQLPPNSDERDSLLEQIRTKSFNLKPAITTRPSIQGPRTNLKVAAILAKANAIRQALAGSDEDDDADSWSD